MQGKMIYTASWLQSKHKQMASFNRHCFPDQNVSSLCVIFVCIISMIYSRVFLRAALLHQQALAHVLIYHFNAEEKQRLAELVNKDFEESVSSELRNRHFSEQLLATQLKVPP